MYDFCVLVFGFGAFFGQTFVFKFHIYSTVGSFLLCKRKYQITGAVSRVGFFVLLSSENGSRAQPSEARIRTERSKSRKFREPRRGLSRFPELLRMSLYVRRVLLKNIVQDHSAHYDKRSHKSDRSRKLVYNQDRKYRVQNGFHHADK